MLGSFATERAAAGDLLAAQVDRRLLTSVVALVPDEWLEDEPGFASVHEVRQAYVDHLLRRVEARQVWQP